MHLNIYKCKNANQIVIKTLKIQEKYGMNDKENVK